MNAQDRTALKYLASTYTLVAILTELSTIYSELAIGAVWFIANEYSELSTIVRRFVNNLSPL
jgi:hypothetical protein